MNSDQNTPGVPAKRLTDGLQIELQTDAQAAIGFLPKTGNIETDERISIAREEGYNPMAIELAFHPAASTTADKLRLFILIAVAAVLVVILFPLGRFFKPIPQDLGPMSIGGPILEKSLTSAKVRNKPWLKVLVEIDRLYFQEGKLSEALRVAESALEKVPEKSRETWRQVYYRYWELLSDSGRVHMLKTSALAYLTVFPEDPFANYYYAQGFLTAADRIRSFPEETTVAYRQQAETVVQQIERTCNALEAQRKHPNVKKDKMTVLTDLYQKLRIVQAKVYVLIWKLGGYEEDQHPDVAYRDKALDICENAELFNVKEAKQLKAIIYTHVLDRWYWLEGQQIIQGRKQKRNDFQKKLETLHRELKETEKL